MVIFEKLKVARSCNSQRHVTHKRDGHCDGWTEQSNNSCVTMRNPLYLVTVYRRIYGQ